MIKKYTILANQNQEIYLTKSGEYLVELVGKKASITVFAGLSLEDKQEISIRLVIHHLASFTQSKVLLKAVANDSSKIELRGKVVVNKGCSNIGSRLEQKVLVLDDRVTVTSVPELEILSRDVSCSHASSITKPNSKQVLYLTSRGLTKQKAVEIIAQGFLKGAINV